MTLKKEKKRVWIPARDVAVDWGTTKTVRVVKVHNVNTLELPDDEWLQFAAITVAMDKPWTPKVHAWLKQLLEGKEVTLEYDPKIRQNRRKYKVAYVYAGGVFVNRTLVERGMARLESTTVKGRYADVLDYFAKRAREAGIGLWAEEKAAAEPEPKKPEQDAPPEPIPDEDDRTYVRHLSDAERAQWARNLQVTVVATGKRTKTDADVEVEDETERVEESVEVRTLAISVKNAWGMALVGLRAQYEVFSKTGKTTESVILLKTGQISSFNLKPGETRQFVTEGVEFKAKDSSDTGWQGNKYYGYRLTFYYKGTPVKVAAMPEWLAGYGPPVDRGPEDEPVVR